MFRNASADCGAEASLNRLLEALRSPLDDKALRIDAAPKFLQKPGIPCRARNHIRCVIATIYGKPNVVDRHFRVELVAGLLNLRFGGFSPQMMSALREMYSVVLTDS
jgi:hypothetical protein